MNPLENRVISPEEIRESCIKQGINALDFFLKQNEIKQTYREPMPVKVVSDQKKVLNVYDSVASCIDFLKASPINKSIICFEDFVALAYKECKNNNVKISTDTPFRGEVANALYSHALRIKMQKQGGFEKVYDHEVCGLLDISLKDGERQIVGKLDRNYVLQNYPIANGEIVFSENGVVHKTPLIEGIENWNSDSYKDIRKILVDMAEDELVPYGRDKFNYLGLEGANFNSYMQLRKALEKHGLSLDALVVERDNKTVNLMRSMINANRDFFKNFILFKGNIDNNIRLDFPLDEELTVSRNNLISQFVVYAGEGSPIPLGDYNNLIDSLGNNYSKKKAGKELKICQKIVGSASNRFNGKFNVVFLDYVGGPIYDKSDILESILRRRTAPRAIIATAYENPDSQFSIFNDPRKIIARQGYEIIKGVSKKYSESRNLINFDIYSLKQKGI